MTSVEFVMLTAGLIVGFITVQSGAMTVGAVTGAMLMLIRLRGPLMGPDARARYQSGLAGPHR